MAATLYQNLLQSPPSDLKKGTRDAIDWFRKQALSIKKVNNNELMKSAQPFKRFQALNNNSIGKMYMFVYDPKTKDVLPYYDTFPLIFPIEFYGDSFLGINLHYLSPILRAKLMDALYSTINNKKYDKTTVLKLSYAVLKGATKFKYFQPCIKKYLISHVGSPFMYVSPDEWDFALMLPTDRFVGASRSTVYKDSLSMVK